MPATRPRATPAARTGAAALWGVFLFAAPAAAQLKVTSDFEGGSATDVVVDAARQVVRLAPAGDATRGWPCWWYARVDGTRAGQPLTLEVTVPAAGLGKEHASTGKRLAADWLFPARATVSDDGTAWRHTDAGKRASDVMTYTVSPAGKTVWVAWGPPFTPADAAALVASAEKASPDAKGFELCRSNGGRPVPALRVREGASADEKRFGVWVGARQHAWESGSSWVARGFVRWLVGDDPRAAWVRQNADVTVVPVMDVDHVATGDGGKNAAPHDHNRDWLEKPHWAEVAAAQKGVAALAKAGRMDLFLDLHNPGPRDGQPFFFVPADDQWPAAGRRNRDRFLAAARAEVVAPFALAEKARTTGPAYDPLWKQISNCWVLANGNPHTVAACLETSWNTPHSTTDGYEAVGRQLGLAVERYLRTPGRERK